MTLDISHIQCPPDGPLNCEIAFVGEAPGSTEVQLRKPFVGASGQLSDSLLGKVGINRRTCYWTNVIKEQPPENDISLFINLARTDPFGAIRGSLARDYVLLLQEELRECRANVFVAYGGIPLYVLCGRQGIMKYHGSILESTLLPGRKVVPVIHPAAALRMYIYRYIIANDLVRVKEESKSPEIVLPDRSGLILEPTFDQCMWFLEDCLNNSDLYDPLVTDIEVVNEEVDCISFAKSPNNGICIPFVTKNESYFTPEHEATIIYKMAEVLERCSIGGQNLAFDATFLFNRYGIRVNTQHDTMVAHAICYPDFPKGLDFITAEYTREPYYKDEGKKWKNVSGDEKSFWSYNAKDSAVCLESLDPLLADVEKLKLREIYDRHVRLIPILTYMQSRGVKVDLEGMAKKKQECIKLSEIATETFQKIVGYAINPNSPKQLITYFYVEKGIKPYLKDGSPTTDDTAMKRLAAKGIDEATIVLEIRKLNKLVGTYLSVTLDSDNRLRGAMNPVGTKTGRLSSSKTIFGTGMNMQNQPGLLKKYMVADNEHVIYCPDLNQAELRILAYIAPDPVFIHAFESGLDPHTLTASQVLDIPYDQISNEDGSSNLGNGERSQRFWGKSLNFSLGYGMGANKFALEYELPLNEATKLRNRHLSVHPGLEMYWQWIRDQLRKDLTITNLFGRRRLFLDRWGDEMFREAYDFVPQSTVADLVNERGLIYLYYNQHLFKHVDLLNQEHDALWFQIPLSVPWTEHSKIISLLKSSLETPLSWRGREFSIPLTVKLGVSVGHVEKVSDVSPESLKLAYETSRKNYNEWRTKS